MRFPEFSQEWKFCKLKSLTKIYDGTHQTPDYKDSGIKFVSVEDIKNLSDSTKFITPEAYFKEFKNKPEFGDILMTRIGDIGTPAIVNINEPLAYYVSLALIKPTGINNAFLKYCIESNSFQHELWRKTIHVAFPKKINKEEIGECSLWTTTEKEQEKIASLLSNIDERINTQNKIIEDLFHILDFRQGISPHGITVKRRCWCIFPMQYLPQPHSRSPLCLRASDGIVRRGRIHARSTTFSQWGIVALP